MSPSGTVGCLAQTNFETARQYFGFNNFHLTHFISKKHPILLRKVTQFCLGNSQSSGSRCKRLMHLHMCAEKGRKWALSETIGRDRNRGDSVSTRGRMTSNVINVRYSPAKNRLCTHFSGRSLRNSIQVIFHVLQVEATLIDGNEGSPQLVMWILRRIKNSFFGRTDWNTCDRHLCRADLA